MPLSAHVFAFVRVHVEASGHMNIHRHHYTELKIVRKSIVSQSINQQLIVFNPTDCAPAVEQQILNGANTEF